MKRVTIKDVAREARVSISTVSNALNDVDVLHPDTKANILEVAERLNYIPNMNGRSLKAKATNVIGLFVNSLKGPYFGVLADSMVWECKKYGYELNVFVAMKKNTVLNNILGRRVDGAIILCDEKDVSPEDCRRFREMEMPTVYLDREESGDFTSSVIFDSYEDGRLAAEYLIEKGITHFGYIHGVRTNYDGVERYRGFRDRLTEAGICLDPAYIWEGGFEQELAYRNVKAFLEKKLPLPQAVFAANDLSAIGCIDALNEAGVSVPKDVLVLGVDDIELCEWFKPTLSTIRTGFNHQGELAVDMLMTMLRGQQQPGEVVKLRGSLIERESTRNHDFQDKK